MRTRKKEFENTASAEQAMSAKIVGLPRPAEPNVRCVFEEFIETQRTRLAPRTLARYEAVLDVLSGYLNGYAHEFLSASEAATRWLRPGWTVSCSLCRVRRSWRLLDVANVYPGRFEWSRRSRNGSRKSAWARIDCRRRLQPAMRLAAPPARNGHARRPSRLPWRGIDPPRP